MKDDKEFIMSTHEGCETCHARDNASKQYSLRHWENSTSSPGLCAALYARRRADRRLQPAMPFEVFGPVSYKILKYCQFGAKVR